VPKSLILFGGLAVAGLFAAPAGGALGPYLAVAGLFLAAVAIAIAVRWKHASRYDLAALRELHDAGGPPPAGDELPDVPDDAGVVCPHCGTLYAAWMLVCPQCKR